MAKTLWRKRWLFPYELKDLIQESKLGERFSIP
nr:hypothetical protein RF2 [Dapsilanthus disjunctus]YP_010292945.1 hypothetical protein RF2 [Dapsilanthus disjunctus]ULQ65117.1 hypothetical protein RF2 [Dapsilanthus disjunctus]ULQ65138.1 hypothetical protein RF2 [Dapsilanthus disjunctus]ULQ65205.1 hypothetical protein RF2 [Dapsilanthus disjunctus]ULQ65226.1 hypothetical protein RF2 [Dapsilanthus disjunctus]